MRSSQFLRFCGYVAAAASIVSGASGAPAAAAESTPSIAVQQRWIIGGEGGWDYLIADGRANRLYISRGSRVDVVDTSKGILSGTVDNTKGVHGIALAQRLGRGFTSNGGDNTVTIFDTTSLKTVGTVPVGEGPDAIIYDRASQRVFTMNGRGNSSTAIDAATGKVDGTIALGGRPEFAAADGQGHVYVNLEDKNAVVEIDSKALKVMNTWPIAPGEEPAGMAVDGRHRRVFSTCHNGMMTVLDADTGKVVATPAIGQGTDAAAFDPRTQNAFSSNGDGTLTVVHEDTPDTYSVSTVQTERGARTMALDRASHKIYLVTAKMLPPAPEAATPEAALPGAAPAPGAAAPGAPNPRRFRRPRFVPGSFTVLVVGPPATAVPTPTTSTTVTIHTLANP